MPNRLNAILDRLLSEYMKAFTISLSVFLSLQPLPRVVESLITNFTPSGVSSLRTNFLSWRQNFNVTMEAKTEIEVNIAPSNSL
jgi:hypothetical protein